MVQARTVASMLGWTTIVVLADKLLSANGGAGDVAATAGLMTVMAEFGRTYVPRFLEHAASFTVALHAVENVEAKKRHQDQQQRRYNHDIERLVGATIQFLLDDFLKSPTSEIGDPERKALRRIGACVPQRWLEAGHSVSVGTAMDERTMLSLALGSAEGIPVTSSFLSEADWVKLLAKLAELCSETRLPADSPALIAAARHCSQNYAGQFYIDLKAAPRTDPQAAEAMRWKGTALIAALAREAATEAKGAREETRSLREDLLRLSGAAANRARADWKKLSGKDKAALTLMKQELERLRREIDKTLALLTVRVEEVHTQVGVVREDVREAKEIAGLHHDSQIVATARTGRQTTRNVLVGVALLSLLLLALIGGPMWRLSAQVAHSDQTMRAWMEAKPQEGSAAAGPPAAVQEAASTALAAKDLLVLARAHIIRKEFGDAENALDKAEAAGNADPFELRTLRGDRYYFDNRPAEAIPWYRSALLLDPAGTVARNNLANALTGTQRDPIGPQRLEAIKMLTEIANDVPRNSRDWAAVQYNLGNAWADVTRGDANENLRKAISFYEAALTVRTREEAPYAWARTKNNLGTAWWGLKSGDVAENLRKAVACYNEALTVRTRTAAPLDWAITQTNLGGAWLSVQADRAHSVSAAIACLTGALEVLTYEKTPSTWASAQINLGDAWLEMPIGDKHENLLKARAAFAATLKVYTRSAAPTMWAFTQHNVGLTWFDEPDGDKGENLRKAISYFQNALEGRTREADPLDWAQTMDSLAAAWRDLPDGEQVENCRKAIGLFQAALEERTREADAGGWAETMKNLGLAWERLKDDDRVGNLRRAGDCFENALQVFTATASPEDNAEVTKHLARVRESLAEVSHAP